MFGFGLFGERLFLLLYYCVLVSGFIVWCMFGINEVLVVVKEFLELLGVFCELFVGIFFYVYLMMDSYDIVLVNGVVVEMLYLGKVMCDSLFFVFFVEIFVIFLDLVVVGDLFFVWVFVGGCLGCYLIWCY